MSRAVRPVAGALVACGLFQVLLLLQPGRTPILLAGGVATTVLAVAALIRHASLTCRATGRARIAWGFTTAATAAWALGSGFYALDVYAGFTAAPPRAGDWFSFLAVVLAPGVLIPGPSAPQSWGVRARLLVDGLMVATALFVPAWPLLLRPTYEQLGSTAGLLTAGIPALHIVSLSISLVLLSRSRGRMANAVTVLAGAFGGFAVIVLVYLYAALHGGSWQAHSVSGGLAAVTVLVLFAGNFPMPVNQRPWAEAPTGLRMALPYVPVAGAFAVAGVLQPQGRVDSVLVAALLLMGFLILIRQFLALRSNAHLLAEVEQQRELLAHQATHDHLTGLANRKLLHARAGAAVGRHEAVALLLIDLDGFKQVNDGFGHAAGDEVLVRVADVLRASTPEGMTAARLGGDEFAILLHPVTDAAAAMALAEQVIAAVAGLRARIGASVGVAFEPEGRATLGGLLIDADAALYRAKAAGKGIAAAAVPAG